MMQKCNLENVLLAGILTIGGFIRLYNLSSVPLGFFADEASIGYNAYSLLSTGKDEYGVPFPIFFRSFGDYRLPLAIYSTIPFVDTLGLNEVSTRLPSMLYGLITIIVMYFVGKEIRSKSFGLLTAFVTATMPWLIHYNRTGFEFTIYATFFTITIFLALKAIRRKSFIIPTFIFSAFTLYTYQPAKLLIVLLLLGLLFIYRRTYLSHRKQTTAGLLAFLILSIPLILSFFNGQGIARFNMVSVFSAKLPFTQSILRIIHNYLTQLSPSYFITGEPTFITRHFIGGLTPLLITTLPFLLIGLIQVFLTIKNKKSAQLLTYWFLIYPIAGAVTADAPFTSRSVIGAPLSAILISLGIATTASQTKRFINSYIPTSLIVTVILLNLAFFVRFYFTQYPLYSSDFWGWQYGAKDIVRYFEKHQLEYDQLILSPDFNSPEMFLKFYTRNNCGKCTIGLPKDYYNPDKKQLFAITPAYFRSDTIHQYKIKNKIHYPDGNIAFQLVEIVK